jgi:carbonic anhydrase
MGAWLNIRGMNPKTGRLAASLSFALVFIFSACSHTPAVAAPAAAPVSDLQNLINGNDRFVEGKALHPNQDLARRAELAKGQKPRAIVLSCSDSRVPPELVFDQGLGDLFVVRVAGNIDDSAAVASIEYAVEHLGVQLIVVLGHDSCGAVKASVQTPTGKSVGSKDLDHLVAQIRKNLAHEKIPFEAASKDPPKDPAMLRESVANVDAVAEDLLKRSHVLHEFAREGKLKVARAVYRLDTGKVEFQN